MISRRLLSLFAASWLVLLLVPRWTHAAAPVTVLADPSTGIITRPSGLTLVPSQSGNSGKFLTTNGTATSWATVSGGGTWGSITGTLSDQTDLGTALGLRLLATNNLSDLANAGTARTNLGLVIGTNVQAYDADLTTWAGVTPGSGVATFLATPSSANLAAAVTDETGTGIVVLNSDPLILAPNNALGALVIDVTKLRNTKTATAAHTFTFSATPSAGTKFGLVLTGDSVDRVITIPSSYSLDMSASITTFTLPASANAEISWIYDGTTYFIAGEPHSITDLTTGTPAVGDTLPYYDASDAGNRKATLANVVLAGMPALTGDITSSAGAAATTLATVNSNVGTFGSATAASVVTVNGKGLVTAASNTTITPAVGSITGLGTGVATALAVNTGSAGAFQVNNGSGASLTSLTAANITAGALANGMTATTQAATDNDTSLATTAFANTAALAGLVGTYASPDTTGGAVTLTNAVTEVWTNTTTTYSLPAVASSTGKAVIFYVVGTNALTLDVNASEIFVRDGTAQTGGVTLTLTGAAGNYVCLVCDGTRWVTLGYKGTLAAGS